jgi:phosphoenolpyruvate-protein phosphotransferase
MPAGFRREQDLVDDQRPPTNAAETRTLQGLGASEGQAIAPALRFRHGAALSEPGASGQSPAADPRAEDARLDAALAQAAVQLRALAAHVERDVGADEAGIFEAQALMLEDPTLTERAHALIETAGHTGARALAQAADEQAGELERLPDPLWRARAADVRDAAGRVVALLVPEHASGDLTAAIQHAARPVVLVTDDLLPSDTAQMPRELVAGICMAGGGATAHAAILARAYGIPAVAGLGEDILADVRDGDLVALDGASGAVHLRPGPDLVATFTSGAEAWRARAHRMRDRARQSAEQPGQTRDGHRVALHANIGSVAEAREAAALGAEGIGLLRTEFLFAGRATLPDEHEQAAIYQEVVAAFGRDRGPIVVRTLDAGNDKPLPALASFIGTLPREENPALGMRGFRLQAAFPTLLRDQLGALVRAAATSGGDLHIMLPMIATVEEVRLARAVCDEVARALAAAGVHPPHTVPLGIMVETPAAVLHAEALAHTADFFSLGTNDLAQYVMASDRLHPRLASLTDAHQPAVLRAIALAARAGRSAGRAVAVCGEMAGDPTFAGVLVGLGVAELSMAPARIAAVKQTLLTRSLQEWQVLAERTLACATSGEVREVLDGVGGA